MPFGQPTSSGIALAPCAHAAHDRSTADRSKVRRSGSRRPVLAEGPAAASTDRHPRRHGELVCRRPGGATLPMSPTPRRVAATGQTRPCPVPPSRGPESRQSPFAGLSLEAQKVIRCLRRVHAAPAVATVAVLAVGTRLEGPCAYPCSSHNGQPADCAKWTEVPAKNSPRSSAGSATWTRRPQLSIRRQSSDITDPSHISNNGSTSGGCSASTSRQ